MVEHEYNVCHSDEEDNNHLSPRNGKSKEIAKMSSMLSIISDMMKPNRRFLYIAACVGNLAAYTCGIALGWTSPEMPKFKQADSPLDSPLTIADESWIGSLLPVGAAIGPFAAGYAADKIGRKKSLIFGVIPFIISFGLFIIASNTSLLYIARFVCGVGVGSVFTVLPMYIGEIADDEVRGALGSFLQLFITFGLTFSYSAGPFTSIKTFNILCIIVPAAFIVLFYCFIPESPYYLVRNSDEDGAMEALMKLRSKSRTGVQKELESIRASVQESLENKAGFADIFKTKSLTKAFIICIGLVTLQQFSGINIVIFYAQDIFTDAGSTLAPEISTILIGIVQIFSSGLTPILVERRGKRFLLLLSAFGMFVSQGVLAYYFYMKEGKQDVSSLSWLPVASLICFIITYCLGFGPLPWAVLGELFPGNIKSVASTLTASICWLFGFFITKYFSLVVEQIGQSGSFGIFSLCCLGAAYFVYNYLPETAGKSLQQIQEMLSK